MERAILREVKKKKTIIKKERNLKEKKKTSPKYQKSP